MRRVTVSALKLFLGIAMKKLFAALVCDSVNKQTNKVLIAFLTELPSNVNMLRT